MAQIYGVYDWRALPLHTAAALAAGLGPGSRCEGVRAGLRVPMRDFLAALCADRLTLLLHIWTQNDTQPILFAPDMVFRRAAEPEETGRFASGEEFLAWWNGTEKGSDE